MLGEIGISGLDIRIQDSNRRSKTMRVTITEIKEMKQRKEKIPMLTAYDYVTARMVDEAGVPLILVGDSLGMVMLGYESTIPVTMNEMVHHTKAVVRGAKKALVIGDMPFMTYHISVSDALSNAARFIQEGGAQAVKLEGGEVVAEKVRRLVDCGIPVMGHIGLTPQSIHQLGGFKVRGKAVEEARKLLNDASYSGGGRRVCYRSGVHPGTSFRADYPEADDPHDWHRRRARL
jgi:3-methyl-2-oxobutanoate hydroxymethyltransferase